MLNALNCTFHHIGVACRDLDVEARYWLMLGYRVESPDFEDEVQRVRGRFLIGPGPRLELLVGTTPDSPVAGMVKRRVKMYHQAFETPDLDKAIAMLEESGARLTAPAAEAVAFGGRRIAFLFLPNGNILELIEAL